MTSRARFEALWEAHYGDVLVYALRRVADEAAAKDVVAETFTIAWRRFDFAPAPSRAWLFGIARKVVGNHYRGERRRDELRARIRDSVDVAHLDPDADFGDGPVVAAFNSLPERDREVLSLVAWEELKPREAAGVLGITAAMFSVRLHRAKRRLRKELALAGHVEGEGAASAHPPPATSPSRVRTETE